MFDCYLNKKIGIALDEIIETRKNYLSNSHQMLEDKLLAIKYKIFTMESYCNVWEKMVFVILFALFGNYLTNFPNTSKQFPYLACIVLIISFIYLLIKTVINKLYQREIILKDMLEKSQIVGDVD